MQEKSDAEFYTNGNRLFCYCKRCDSARPRKPLTAEQKEKAYKRQKLRMAAKRLNPEKLAWKIISDCKSYDFRRGLMCDLDEDFVWEEIKKGCNYCGDHDGKLSLDRIDNSIGHIKTNVVPCCYRCNMIKRDMPQEAWLLIAPAVRRAFEAGMFGDWSCGPHAARRTKRDTKTLLPLAAE